MCVELSEERRKIVEAQLDIVTDSLMSIIAQHEIKTMAKIVVTHPITGEEWLILATKIPNN